MTVVRRGREHGPDATKLSPAPKASLTCPTGIATWASRQLVGNQLMHSCSHAGRPLDADSLCHALLAPPPLLLHTRARARPNGRFLDSRLVLAFARAAEADKGASRRRRLPGRRGDGATREGKRSSRPETQEAYWTGLAILNANVDGHRPGLLGGGLTRAPKAP